MLAKGACATIGDGVRDNNADVGCGQRGRKRPHGGLDSLFVVRWNGGTSIVGAENN
jgi:hypothetical protein